MNLILLWVVTVLAAVAVGLLVVLLVRSPGSAGATGRDIREELRASREESRTAFRELREEVSGGIRLANETLVNSLNAMGALQREQLDSITRQLKELTESNHTALKQVRDTLDTRVRELQQGNEEKLEAMRKTVDEKLHEALEKRLGDSFKLVSERLEAVHKGLGEMQSLAAGVGDLKRVLSNVKTRGTWAEFKVGAILEQILAPSQYAQNVAVKAGSSERVEFAVRLPGRREEPGSCVWLPIDSKFPQEDYLRLQEAAEKGDAEVVQAAAEALARAVRAAAKDIHDKYISPPHTTDFAVMFLATEGLYAEVLRQPRLVEEMQQTWRVVPAGPTTLAALLSSLRMGFQTLAIEQRANEVWRVLAAVKTEFAKFGEVLDRLKRQLHAATETIEKTGVRSRAMERTLRSLEQLPASEASAILALPPAAEDDDHGEDHRDA